jgi:hypothetical protein
VLRAWLHVTLSAWIFSICRRQLDKQRGIFTPGIFNIPIRCERIVKAFFKESTGIFPNDYSNFPAVNTIIY